MYLWYNIKIFLIASLENDGYNQSRKDDKFMDIAICDDEKNLRENLSDMIKEQYEDCNVDLYDSGNALLNTNKNYDIYFLDIQMAGIDGMKTAEQIRANQKNTSESIIIFITAFQEYMNKAFDVKAFHYLVKPIDKNKFKSVFLRAVSDYTRANENADKHILIKTGSVYNKILLGDIFYFESQGKKIIAHSKNGAMEYYGKMQEIEKILGDSFFRCHRCYIVNMDHITRYSATSIQLSNGDDILLAQKKFQEFVKIYMQFAKGGGLVHE